MAQYINLATGQPFADLPGTTAPSFPYSSWDGTTYSQSMPAGGAFSSPLLGNANTWTANQTFPAASIAESVVTNLTTDLAGKVPVDALVYNVLNHSIVADNSTDNTTAYATLVALVVAAGGGIIEFPPSTSAYVGSLVINANVPIKVIGYGATLLGPSGGTTLTINTGQTGGSAQTVMVEGLIIKGNADQTTDGVLVRDSSRARLANLQIVRTNNAVRIQNYAASQNSEGTTIRSSLANDCITGVLFEIVSGGPSFDETFIDDFGVNNCTTGFSLPTGANFVRTYINATVWVGRASSSNGVVMHTDADMTRMWIRLGGELYATATGAVGLQPGPNATNFEAAEIWLHFQSTITTIVDTSLATTGAMITWRDGVAFRGLAKSTASGNLLGPYCMAQIDTFPRSGFSMGSASNAPMPGGRDGLFFGSGAAQADVVLFRPGIVGLLQMGFANSFKTGQSSTGSLPSASTHTDGSTNYDTTRHRPVWSDGTNWGAALLDIGGGRAKVKTAASASATTLDLNTGSTQNITLSVANSALTVTNPGASGTATVIDLVLTQDATGSRTVTWPTGTKWPGGTTPTLTTTAAKIDLFRLTSLDGGTSWLGETRGLNY